MHFQAYGRRASIHKDRISLHYTGGLRSPFSHDSHGMKRTVYGIMAEHTPQKRDAEKSEGLLHFTSMHTFMYFLIFLSAILNMAFLGAARKILCSLLLFTFGVVLHECSERQRSEEELHTLDGVR